MADARPIVFGPGDKLRQLEAVAMDPAATDLDCRVSVAVMCRLDKYTGDAVVGQSWIAGAIGCGERTVRVSACRMQKLGLWRIASGGGRGLANRWTPTAPKRGSQPPGLSEKHGTWPPGFGAKTRQMTPLNPAYDATKPGSWLPPLPNTLQNSSLPRAPDAIGDGEAAWQPIKQAIAQRTGPDVFAGWFGKVTLGEVQGTEVVLLAPNTFVRNSIVTRFEVQILDACKAAVPGAESVRVVERARWRPTATASLKAAE